MTEKHRTTSRNATVKTKPARKKARVVALLRRKSGATLDQLAKATGWQAHSVRAALCRLRQQGLGIEREHVRGVSRYRIPQQKAA